MRIGFTTKGKGWDARMDKRFGRAAFIAIYDEEKDELIEFDNSERRKSAHGAGPGTARLIIDERIQCLITGNGPGGNTARLLDRAGIEIFTGAGDLKLKEAYEAFKKNSLTNFNQIP